MGWVIAATMSAGLGLALYSTSLAGSPTGYQEAAFTPRPTSTVVKTRTKIVRKPARTHVVYVPRTTAPAVPQRVAGATGDAKSSDSRAASSDD